MRVDHRHVLIPLERHPPAQQLKRRAPQRVLIGPPIHRLALDLLWRHIRHRAQHHPRPRQHRRRPAPGQPEIRQVHVVRPARPRVDQYVRRLDIAVHQPRPVRGIQRAGHRRDDRRRPPRRQRLPAAQQPPDVPPGHVPHRDEQHPARLTGLIHRQDVGVINRGGGPGLAQEPAAELLVTRQPRRQYLQRHQPTQPLIAGAEHHRHPARADLLLQHIPGDPRPRGQHDRPPAGTPGPSLAHHASSACGPPGPAPSRRGPRTPETRPARHACHQPNPQYPAQPDPPQPPDRHHDQHDKASRSPSPAGRVAQEMRTTLRSDFLLEQWEKPDDDRPQGRESVSEYSVSCIDIRADDLLISACG